MSDERLRPYAPMWTTEKDRYGLLEVALSNRTAWLVFNLEAMAPMTMDDDEDVIDTVLENMRRAGVRILTREETRREAPR